MNHLPFKEWLLSEEPLPEDQTLAFQDHLRDCADCRQVQESWSEVQGLLRHSTPATPRAGFTTRWTDRLAARQARRQRVRMYLALAAGILVIMVISVLLSSQISVLFQSPVRFLTMCLAQLASVFVLFSSLQDYVLVLIKSFPVLPLIGLVLAIGSISFWGVLWAVTYQQIVIARRFSK